MNSQLTGTLITKVRNFIAIVDLCRRESGQGLIEYGSITALIAVTLVASLGAVAGGISNEFSTVAAQMA